MYKMKEILKFFSKIILSIGIILILSSLILIMIEGGIKISNDVKESDINYTSNNYEIQKGMIVVGILNKQKYMVITPYRGKNKITVRDKDNNLIYLETFEVIKNSKNKQIKKERIQWEDVNIEK